METKIEVGDKVKCKKFGSLKHDFIGSVEKKYENSAVVAILEHDNEDSVAVTDFHNEQLSVLTAWKKFLLNFKKNVTLTRIYAIVILVDAGVV